MYLVALESDQLYTWSDEKFRTSPLPHCENAATLSCASCLRSKRSSAVLSSNATNDPHIAWGEIPVRIPTEPIPWPSGQDRRVAGVSSFGFTGTNAHVVLEEAPVRKGAEEEKVERP